jgi:hypothetical protein
MYRGSERLTRRDNIQMLAQTVSNKYVAYFPEFSSIALQQFVSTRATTTNVPAIQLFLARYKAFPCLSLCPRTESNALFHVPSILNYLQTHFGHDITNDIISRKYHKRAKQFFVRYVFKKQDSVQRLILCCCFFQLSTI